MIQTILFDLDGTIIDSEPLALQAIEECARDWGLPVTRDEAASVAGKKWEVAFDLLFQRYKFPVSRDEASRVIVGRYKEIVQAGVRAVPGVVEAIHDLAGHFQLGLVSGSHRADVLWAVRHLKVDHRFLCVYGAEDYPLSKPAPDGFLKAIGTLKADPARTLVFEDSAAGIASALAAGAKVAAIESTNHFGHDQSPAHVRIPDFKGVDADWVRNSFR